ncbi:MAG: relaxase/mobilization nuclease domain-containing protein [Oscillospiraceae bacterium]|nr:relaxase/mobilization nuclease domain-containing protein [Oscillospiraceae bacterium]
MATIKHLSSKNSDLGAAERYLIFQHDESNNKPVLDEYGHLIPREDYRIDTVLCGDEDFAIACMKTNLAYNKNLSRGDVKTHHYIISFDPRDAEDNGLTMDRAHELGLEFCKKHFPGHQALVATHPDGHNKSGNIHVHIVINSLRIERVPRMPYMDKDCDMLPGMKHRCTSAALRYFRAEVMEMCQREGLYQIDLLNGSNNRITEREYWAQKQGQKKLDEENAELIANGEEPKQTKFETDKQILRQQIRAALKKSKTLEDFFDVLLEDYGVAVKESRGRFSYLTPERTKPITSRKLGDDFSKEAILAALEKNAARVIPSVRQKVPVEKSEIEKLIDLEAKRAEGKGEGYIHWGTVFNLKTMAKTLLYLQENGMTDLDALDAALAESHEKTKTARTDLKKIEAELNAKKELQRHILNAWDGRDLHAEYLKLPKKKQEKFYEENRPALMLYDAAMRYFKENGVKTIPTAKRIQGEIEDLTSAKNDGYTEYRASQKREKELQTVKANIEKMLRQQEPKIELGRKWDEQEL